ncbi:2-amino-4-hydroxy-6-hydroxymethyldihydropteridine diphosphokinase [Bifidobacterium miconisargentati]|uniref:2-amino-4-hydroxy-6- hydroxymethyldihydropteridine diphosphokinase n=1 Tax=Bifidobacterium miconisargentati TaxID=2834437 RepID=UPI001BDBD8C9|nr:2-amino-4-hydroxy-6-hydroxymethyldihydropteridine diphosphokinase [Bifidobacterium miconisargentati]MBW3090960.1 2-amino-4-hydroxy-6-hydroxymethyldihydropteridine diphosphokinase [Bifidobacterium miconisargentati]
MDTIRLTGVRANGTHGVLDFEHERAQPFVVDATLYLDLSAAGRTDALTDTVDYGRAAKEIVAVIEGGHVDLIERMAQLIADRLLAIDPIAKVDVTVHKPHAPITVPFDDVAVSITRERVSAGAVEIAATAGNQAVSGDDSGTDGTDGRIRTADSAQVRHSSPTPRSTMHHAVVALGGNIGEVESTLRAAVREIDGLPGTQVTGISPLFRTAAWGMADGAPDFLNAVIELETTMGSHELLAALQQIEADHGRTREHHWDSRPLDLDIIDFDGITSADEDLALPHPRAWQRAFVLGPWDALNPNARLAGAHGGLVHDLLAAAPDRDAVELAAEDWMLGGRHGSGAGDSAATPAVDASARAGETASDMAASAQSSASPASMASADAKQPVDQYAPAVSRRAVISMDSTSTDAERLFREAIVTIDGIPGNQVEGISPLYHVAHFDGPDAMSAVMQIETKLPAADLIAALGAVEASQEGLIDLDLVDMDGVTSDEPNCRVPWPSARTHASVLAPWMDMDPNATLGGDPVSFLLAMAPDAGQVGMLSDNWILSQR